MGYEYITQPQVFLATVSALGDFIASNLITQEITTQEITIQQTTATNINAATILSGDQNLTEIFVSNTFFSPLSVKYDTITSIVESNSASWEESADILPTVTNYLSTELVTVSSLNVTQQLLSSNTDLLSIFLTPNNTLTTSICAMSGDGVTPFVMQFTNGLLTSLTV